jgi:hypothetical protein
VTGIEPALSAWEAEVLPLNYTRATLCAACRVPANSTSLVECCSQIVISAPSLILVAWGLIP